ncbi:MAG: hypothetical protein M1444_03895 [Patescibacteria group bacterium]|nr:hypothetical protein [Patescibacteria group bacterium]
MKQKDILTLLIPSFILIVAWIIFSIYHSSATSTIPPAVDIQISPIKPIFDMDAVSKLKQRQKVIPIYERGPAVSPSPTPGFPNIFSSSLSASELNGPGSPPQGSTGGVILP